jgi:exopolysaccharide biosynthesis polyprenyl glycosylphosphotransferase
MGEYYLSATFGTVGDNAISPRNDESTDRNKETAGHALPVREPFAIRNHAIAAITISLIALDGTFAALVGRALVGGAKGWLAPFVCSVVIVILGQMCGLYAVKYSSDLQRTARNIAGLGLITVVAAIGGLILTGHSPAALPTGLALLGGFSLAIATRAMAALGLRYAAPHLIERVLLVGKSEPSNILYEYQSLSPHRVSVVGHFVVGNGDSRYSVVGRLPPACDTANFDNHSLQIDRVAILDSELSDIELDTVLRGLDAVSCPIHLLMELPGIDRSRRANRYQTLILREAAIKPLAMLLKRAQDVTISLLLLAVVAPLLLLIGVMIRLDSRGPAIFRQTRLGRDNQPFVVYKFRTMSADAPGNDGSIQAVRGDARLTKIGRFLRKTSLDELPQLLNVLEGSMSLVGPRPHPVALNKRFMTLVENYSARHRITPGITGWAQVNGSRGETSTIEQMQRRVDLDLEYLHNCSLSFDVWILLRTVISVLSLSDAY